MSNPPFALALRELQKSDRDHFLHGLHRMFVRINMMDADELIAAAQTIRTAALAIDAGKDPVALGLLNAVRTRMCRFADDSDVGIRQKLALLQNFDNALMVGNIQVGISEIT